MDYKIAARSHEFNRKKGSISSLINESTINSFEAGYEYCQKEYEEKLRWIPIEEKIPEITGWDYAPYIVKTKKEYLIAGYTDGWFHHIGGLCLKKGAVTHYRSFL